MKSNISQLPLQRRETIGWIDALRVIAALLVVFAHSCDSFVSAFDTDKSQFLTGVFAGSLTRPCVPLFVMMTGVLLLPVSPTVSLGAFYRKRIGRIIIPLIFWSLALPIAFWAYFSTAGAASANPMLSPADYDSASLHTKLYTWIFNFNFDTVPLWYLYMLIGLYLIMPMLSAWLRTARRSEVKLLLAYYLSRWPRQWTWRKTWAICLPMFAIGYSITALGYIWFQQLFPGDYAYLEIIWLFCGINVLMMTLPVFIIVQKWNTKSRPWLTRMASLSFGVYLCHFIFVYITYDLFNTPTLPAWTRICLGALTAATCSYALAALLWRRPLRRLIA